jgi:hypothetical protein
MTIMKTVLVLNAAARNTRAYGDATLGVRRAMRELNKLGSTFDGPIDDAPNESTQVLTWTDLAHASRVRLFSDLENNVMYLQSEAPSPEAMATLERELRNHVSIASLDELKQRAPLEKDGTGCGLVRLAFGAPTDVDAEIAAQLKSAIRNDDPLVRRNAGFAMAITTWPELAPTLAEAIEVEERPELRDVLRRYAEVLEKVKRAG